MYFNNYTLTEIPIYIGAIIINNQIPVVSSIPRLDKQCLSGNLSSRPVLQP